MTFYGLVRQLLKSISHCFPGNLRFRRCFMITGPQQIGAWFRKNNPLYLLSVVLMLTGLYLAGSELESGKVTGMAVSGFFFVQNLYEIIMVAMALYLLKNKIQPEHGKALLFFVLLFLGDLTFYQVRISGLSTSAGNVATGIYMLLAVIKIAAVVKVLGLTVHRTRLAFAAGAFSLIWIAPKVAYMLVDSIGRESFGFFDGSYVFYSLWLIAGLIHLPLIVENWRENNLAVPAENEYLGNETVFWRWLIIFPFVILPLQMAMNVMSDSFRYVTPTLPVMAVVAPWVLAAAFFAQTLWRHLLTSQYRLMICDSLIMGIFFLVVKLSSSDFNLSGIINHVFLVAGLSVTWLTRANMVNGGILGMMGLWHAGAQMLSGAKTAVAYGAGLSRIAWAGILMLVSFVSLLAGFLFSLHRNGNDPTKPENEPDLSDDQSANSEDGSIKSEPQSMQTVVHPTN